MTDETIAELSLYALVRVLDGELERLLRILEWGSGSVRCVTLGENRDHLLESWSTTTPVSVMSTSRPDLDAYVAYAFLACSPIRHILRRRMQATSAPSAAPGLLGS